MFKDYEPAIVLLSETRTTADMYDAEFYIENYKCVRCDSDSRHTGGVIIYIHENISFKVISNYERDRAWFLAIQVIKGYHTTGIFGVVYRSFQTTNAVFLNNVEEWLEQIINHNKLNFIFGDFNIDLKSNEFYSLKLNQLIKDYRLTQVVQDYTRVTQTSKTLIDLLLTNSTKIQCEVIKEQQISDHCILSADISKGKMKLLEKRKVIEIRSWKNYSENKLNCILNHRLQQFQTKSDLNENAEELILELKNAVKELTQTKNIESRNAIPWVSENLKLLKEEKMRSYNIMKITNTEDNWEKYRKARNLFKQSIRKEQSEYLKNKFIENQFNPKELWKTLKSMYKTKNSTQWSIQFNSKTLTDKQELAEALNHAFVSSVIDIHKNIPEITDWNSSEGNENENYGKFYFREITQHDIINTINKTKSQYGIEGINKKVMLDAMKNPNFAGLYTDLVNQSLNEAVMPTSWKISTVIPIPKTAKPTIPEDLRPINMLPIYESVLERLIKTQLVNHIAINNILVDQQSGFREFHSCETALNLMLDNWKMQIDKNKSVIAVFLDFKRAFETIDREILLRKLNKYGIQGREIEWFNSYLQGRQQYTKVDNFTSSKLQNNLGVPQGSTLGPLLFIIYINDIVDVIKNCQVNMFADDTLITISATTYSEAVQKVNEDLENLRKWLIFHKLSLNISKTKYMLLSIKTKFEDNAVIVVGNQNIERVKQYKYLGVVLDENLYFDQHLDYIAKKMNKKFGLFSRIKNKLPMETKIIFYKSLVAPHIDYCSSVLFIMNQTQIKRLQKIQNRFMRGILNTENRTHVKVMLEKLNWKSINQRIQFNVLKLLFRIDKGELPKYLNNLLSTNSDIHNYNTRNTHFRLPKYSKSFSQRSLGYNGVKLYNSLSNYCKLDLQSLEYSRFTEILHRFVKEKIDI